MRPLTVRPSVLFAGFVVFGLLIPMARQTGLLLPLDLYLVAWHESMHALASWVTGGHVLQITVRAHDGVTTTSGGIFPVVSMAGYLGTALWGAVLLLFSRARNVQPILRAVTVGLPPLVMLFGNGLGLSLLMVVLMSVALSVAWGSRPFITTLFISAFFASEAWKDVEVYLIQIPGQTDAGILAGYLGLPFMTLPIALFMAIVSALIWWFAIRRTLARSPNTSSPHAGATNAEIRIKT